MIHVSIRTIIILVRGSHLNHLNASKVIEKIIEIEDDSTWCESFHGHLTTPIIPSILCRVPLPFVFPLQHCDPISPWGMTFNSKNFVVFYFKSDVLFTGGAGACRMNLYHILAAWVPGNFLGMDVWDSPVHIWWILPLDYASGVVLASLKLRYILVS